jgi:hypothetical protein
MSGGSHDYLYVKDADDLLAMEDVLDRMASDLAAVGYAEDAAEETEHLLHVVRQYRVRANVTMRRLGGVWRAMEMWKSCDWSEDSIKDALREYRERHPTG